MKAFIDKYVPKCLKDFFDEYKDLFLLIAVILGVLLIAAGIACAVFLLFTREKPEEIENAEEADEEDDEDDDFIEQEA